MKLIVVLSAVLIAGSVGADEDLYREDKISLCDDDKSKVRIGNVKIKFGDCNPVKVRIGTEVVFNINIVGGTFFDYPAIYTNGNWDNTTDSSKEAGYHIAFLDSTQRLISAHGGSIDLEPHEDNTYSQGIVLVLPGDYTRIGSYKLRAFSFTPRAEADD